MALGDSYNHIDEMKFLLSLKSDAVNEVVAKRTPFNMAGRESDNAKVNGIAEVLKKKHDISQSVKGIYDDANRSGGADAQVQDLGRYIAYKCQGQMIPGPVKGVEGAMRKLLDFSEGGYKGDTAKLKDIVRITLIGNSPEIYQNLLSKIRTFCIPSNKYQIIKDKTVTGNDNECGYSGANIVVTLPCKRPGEIQVNNRAIMYGKMSKGDYCRYLQVSEADYFSLSNAYRIEGGLGHALYEIWRVDRLGENGKRAAALSKEYNDYLRSFPRVAGVDALNEKLQSFKGANEAVFSHS